MKYKVIFQETVTQNELNSAIVETDTEEDAVELVENGAFDEIQPLEVAVIDSKDFEIISVEPIE